MSTTEKEAADANRAIDVREAAASVVEQWMREPEGSVLLERRVCELEIALEPEDLVAARARLSKTEVKLLVGFFTWLAKEEKVNPRQTTAMHAALEYLNTFQPPPPLPPAPLPSMDKELGSFADTNAMRPKVSLAELTAEYEKNLKDKP